MAGRVLQIGIDEAGYAPRLGPLVVTGVACSRPAKAGDLYECLAPVVRGEPTRAARGPKPLFIGDSKVVYGAGKRLDELERGALAFLKVALGRSREGEAASPRRVTPSKEPDATRPRRVTPSKEPDATRTDLALARALDAEGLDLSGLAWYGGGPTALPVAADAADVGDSAARLERALAEAAVRDITISSRVVTARALNRAVASGLNKAEFEVELVAELLGSLAEPLAAAGESAPREAEALVDRLGGRTDYRPLLESAFPRARVRELAKGKAESRYAVEGPNERWRASVAFACRAEALSMLVALASMVSKYVRELFMKRLNRWFAAALPALRPTAGYPVDAARFLADTAEFRARAGIADEVFVRAR